MAGIPTMIASIGFKAIGSKILGTVGSGFHAVGDWVGKQDSIVRVLVIALALFAAFEHVELVMERHHSAKVEGQLATASKALASARTDLATSQANEKTLRDEVAKQNAALSAQEAKAESDQKAAHDALGAATARANEAEATNERLRASARPLAPVAGCETDPDVKDQWK